MLLVDDRQAEPGEAHLLLDHRVGADHQRGLARGHLLEHLRPRLALAAAGQPGDGDAERRQPADQLLQVLLGQDLGRRHQRALPAGVDGDAGGERGHHRLAGADVALQQAMHRQRPRQVGGDLVGDAALRLGQAKRQVAQQRVVAAAADRRERRRALRLALALGLQLRQLLRQQLVELEALPGRMRAVFERLGVEPRRRLVQPAQGLAQGRQVRRQQGRRHDLVEIGARQAAGDRLAQHRLRQLHRARVDRRQRGRQGRARRHDLEARMHHLQAEEAAARLAAGAHPLADRQRLLLRRIEVEEAQHQVVAVLVLERDDELAARPELDLRVADDRLDLAGLAVAQRRDRDQPGLVLVAQRQVQREVDVAHQAELFERLVGGRDRAARRRPGALGRGRGHGRILPAGQRR